MGEVEAVTGLGVDAAGAPPWSRSLPCGGRVYPGGSAAGRTSTGAGDRGAEGEGRLDSGHSPLGSDSPGTLHTLGSFPQCGGTVFAHTCRTAPRPHHGATAGGRWSRPHSLPLPGRPCTPRSPHAARNGWGKVTGPSGVAPGALPLTCLLTPHWPLSPRLLVPRLPHHCLVTSD